jgi:hypothetical protein
MSFIRTVDNHGHPCRQLVEAYWDKKTKTKRNRILRQLGPVNPVYRRSSPTEPHSLPLPPVHFGLLATHMMSGTVTAAHVIQTVQEMGMEMPPGDLSAVGIRFDLGEKTLSLLLWLTPPSPDHPPAKPARHPGRFRDTDSRPRSSPSKAPVR